MHLSTIVVLLLSCAAHVMAEPCKKGSNFHVMTESCTQGANCTDTICTNDYQSVCEFPVNAAGTTLGQGLCTCGSRNIYCATRDDCLVHHHGFTCDDTARIHCYDEHCICSRFHIHDH